MCKRDVCVSVVSVCVSVVCVCVISLELVCVVCVWCVCGVCVCVCVYATGPFPTKQKIPIVLSLISRLKNGPYQTECQHSKQVYISNKTICCFFVESVEFFRKEDRVSLYSALEAAAGWTEGRTMGWFVPTKPVQCRCLFFVVSTVSVVVWGE